MAKRGQITLFIIAALLVMLLLGFLIVTMSKDGSQTRHNDVALDAAVRSYVNSCIDREVKDSIELFGVDPAASSQY
ncbi:hypothetical protein HYY72_02370, partial [Candidatus Woesearchaeota archaeon]|nr:hypothetical protein [Candidatus Woesearchaeota archaeon]